MEESVCNVIDSQYIDGMSKSRSFEKGVIEPKWRSYNVKVKGRGQKNYERSKRQ